MLKFKHGNIFDEYHDIKVNPVNCVGVMGKGLALEFKKRYPDNFYEYKKACNYKELTPGRVFVFIWDEFETIANFTTKDHWRNPSKMEYITEGLKELKKLINFRNPKTVAIPALGCGLGGLKWLDVKKEIINILKDIEDTDIIVYSPEDWNLKEVK